MPKRVKWVYVDELYPVYGLHDFLPDLPPDLLERHRNAMRVFWDNQRELRELYYAGKSSLDIRDGYRKVDHPAVPDDSIPLPYEEYDR